VILKDPYTEQPNGRQHINNVKVYQPRHHQSQRQNWTHQQKEHQRREKLWREYHVTSSSDDPLFTDKEDRLQAEREFEDQTWQGPPEEAFIRDMVEFPDKGEEESDNLFWQQRSWDVRAPAEN